MPCDCGKCQDERARHPDGVDCVGDEDIERLKEALRPFAEAYEHATREGNLGGAYDRIGLEHLRTASEVLDGFA